MKHKLRPTNVFHQLAVNYLLELCTHNINNQPIVKLTGRLCLTVVNGDVFEIIINEEQTNDVSSYNHEVAANLSPELTIVTPELLAAADCYTNDIQFGTNLVAIDGTDELFADGTLSELESAAHQSAGTSPSCYVKLIKADEFEARLHDRLNIATNHIKTEIRSQSPVTRDTSVRAGGPVTRGSSVRAGGPVTRNTASKRSVAWARKVKSTRAEINNRKTTRGATNNHRKTTGRMILDKRKAAKSRVIDDEVENIECSVCSERFNTRKMLKRHNYYEHKLFTCERCGSTTFNGHKQFAQHIHTVHPGIAVYKINCRFVCEFCSAECRDESDLSDHIATRHNGYVHRCPQCDKQLGSAQTLRIHIEQLHNTSKRRTCEVCGRQFGRLAGLVEHLYSSHPNSVPEKYQQGRYQLECNYCGLKLSRRGTLLRHIETKHSDGPNHTCTQCGRQFMCRRYLLRHIRGVHHSVANKHTIELSAANNNIDNSDIADDPVLQINL